MKNAKPTLKNAQLAFCHECLGYYTDSNRDCGNTRCPLYSFHSYAELEPDLNWTKINPKRKGIVLFSDCEDREMPEQTKRALENKRNEKTKPR